MVGSGSEEGKSAERAPRWVSASFVSLVLGLVVYAAGAILYSYGWHEYQYWNVGEDRSFAFDMLEWGTWVERAGISLVILGLVFYVAGRRKVA